MLINEKNPILKVGIIGCGGITLGKHLSSLVKLPEVALTAFCDILPEKAKEAVEKFGTNDTRIYTDYRELLEDKSIDVIHVCTPNKSHGDITVDSLKAGKHMSCVRNQWQKQPQMPVEWSRLPD